MVKPAASVNEPIVVLLHVFQLFTFNTPDYFIISANSL